MPPRLLKLATLLFAAFLFVSYGVAHAAIAFDNSGGQGDNTTNDLTFTYTVNSNTNGVLVCGISSIHGPSAVHPTSVTYNGTAMSLLQNGSYNNPFQDDMYGLLAPSTGAHTVEVKWSGSTENIVICASYTGVKQSGLPDSSNANSCGTGATCSVATTVVASNVWLVGFGDTYRSSVSADNTVNNGTTRTTEGATNPQLIIMDSGGTVGTGSQSLQEKSSYGSGMESSGITIVSLAPDPGGATISSLNQYHSDATTTIAEGSTTKESTVVFGGTVAASTGTVRLEVEAEPAGVSFTNTATAMSSYLSSGSHATTSIVFVPGSYHWQARAATNSTSSAWQAFGSASTSFIVDPAESAYFDGSSAWKYPATNLGFNSTDPFTVEFWYKTALTTTTMQILDSRSSTSSNGFAIWKDQSGINFLQNCDGGTSSTIHLAGAAHLASLAGDAAGNWHHVAIIKATTASSTDAYKLYFDTVQQEGQKCYASTSTDSIWIGGNPSSSVNLFAGNIDEVRVWKTERSSTSITTYYDQEVASTDSNLLGLWRFNATSTDLVTGKTPTTQGGPTFSTDTPFGHFLLGFSSVNNRAVHYNASTTYSGALSAAVSTWNGNPQRAIVVTSTVSTTTAELLVSDAYNSSTLANVAGQYCVAYAPCDLHSTTTQDTVFLNTYALSSSTVSSTQNTVTHELGHSLGLAHSWYGNVMNYYQTTQTYLGPQDISDYNFLYH